MPLVNIRMTWLVVTVIVVSIASCTFLAYERVIDGATVATLITLVISAVGVSGAVHVTGEVVKTTSGNGTAPTTPAPVAPTTGPPNG